MAFGFAQPLQRRLPSGTQTAQQAMQQSLAAGAQPAAAQPAATPQLPPLQPTKPAGPATMMPDISLPPLVPPTVKTAPSIEDASGAVGDAVKSIAGGGADAGGLSAAGGDGMDIGELLAALFG